MFHIGTHGLGEAQDTAEIAPGGFPNWLPEEGCVNDADLISVAYYSPPSNYPPQRIGNYNIELAEHQTLNGIASPLEMVGRVGVGKYLRSVSPMMRLPAYDRGFLGSIGKTRLRTEIGEPVRRTIMQPRYRII